MAFFRTNQTGRVTGNVMLSRDDMLPVGTHSSAVDMALDAGANFVPVKHPLVHPSGHTPENRGTPTAYSVWNESVDPPALLNPAVSHGYPATPYMQTIDMVEAAFPNSCTGLAMIEQGKVLVVTLELTGAVDLGGGDIIKPCLMVTDSQDGSRSTQIHSFMYRAACENAQSYDSKLFSARHTKNHSMIIASWATYISRAQDSWDTFLGRAKQMRAITFESRSQAKNFLFRVIPMPERDPKDTWRGYASKFTRWENKVDAIMKRYDYESDEFGHNAWCMVQSIQGWEYHDKTKGNFAKQVDVVTDPASKQAVTIRAERLALA
jgi:hypothetical protein